MEHRRNARIRFSRKASAAYLAHLDMMRLFERAIQRSQICCEYTQGFNPKLMMTFALPLGVGVESIDDYADIAVCEKTKALDFIRLLNPCLPADVQVLAAAITLPEKDSLMSQVVYAGYSFYSMNIGRLADVIDEAERLDVVKHTKSGDGMINAKDYIIECKADGNHLLQVIVKAGSKVNLRPDLLLRSIIGIDGFTQKDANNTQIIRTGIYTGERDGIYIRPFISGH